MGLGFDVGTGDSRDAIELKVMHEELGSSSFVYFVFPWESER